MRGVRANSLTNVTAGSFGAIQRAASLGIWVVYVETRSEACVLLVPILKGALGGELQCIKVLIQKLAERLDNDLMILPIR